MEIIVSDRGNKYVYERGTGFISLIPDTFAECSEVSPDSYYTGKLRYLEEHGLISITNSSEPMFRLLEEHDIADAIFNTHQIIFEVTDKCNLSCRYCGYGGLYDNYDERQNRNMSFETFRTLYEYLKDLWTQTPARGCTYLRISFYGGEPLCNFHFIEKAVAYTKTNPIPNKRIVFSMTTNAVLLDRYMTFLVDNQFELLISLDGGEHNQSYRVFKNGENSFKTVIKNVDKLHSVFPSFFQSNVKFNSVLHDRNSVKEADDFIFGRYQKHPLANELNVFGVAAGKREEFRKMFHSISKEFKEMTVENKRRYSNQSSLLRQCGKWVFNTIMMDYSYPLSNVLTTDYGSKIRRDVPQLPTGTCIPFSRKIFVSVNNKIYPCERIGNEFDFGNISRGKVNIHLSKIIEQYNDLFNRYIRLCRRCEQQKGFCSVCIASDIHGYKICEANIGNSKLKRDLSLYVSCFDEDPQVFDNALTKMSIV